MTFTPKSRSDIALTAAELPLIVAVTDVNRAAGSASHLIKGFPVVAGHTVCFPPVSAALFAAIDFRFGFFVLPDNFSAMLAGFRIVLEIRLYWRLVRHNFSSAI
jgi:hypothetical protein